MFQACELSAINIVKIKIIQALIQIERPFNWNREKLLDTIKNLIILKDIMPLYQGQVTNLK